MARPAPDTPGPLPCEWFGCRKDATGQIAWRRVRIHPDGQEIGEWVLSRPFCDFHQEAYGPSGRYDSGIREIMRLES